MTELKFQKLTPTNDVDMNAYEDGFKFVFDEEDICNVAISGPYASGKSSVLETCEKIYGDKNFLHVTLTHFQSNDDNKEEEESTKNKEKDERDIKEGSECILEARILNQLIHQIAPDKIPETNFKLKHGLSGLANKSIRTITIWIAFVLFSLIFLLNGKFWSCWVDSIKLEWMHTAFFFSTTHVFQFVVGVFLCACLILGIYQVIKYLNKNNMFRKIRICDAEIDFLPEEADTYLDKYLDEIIYIFRQSKVDVVVFEDIDRYGDMQVFESLRELNTLINNAPCDENDKKVKFFYLMCDDFFVKPKDRTKFFDFIIPVIPVINGSNSYNKLKQYLEENNLFDKFDSYFLREICLYLDDLRLVKNIVDEFLIYEKSLSKINPDYNKLLAIIVYKNTFPKDYSYLIIRKGYVYTLLKLDSEQSSLKDLEPIPLTEQIGGDVNSEFFKNPEFKNVQNSDYFDLLKYLITYGYIDETYEDYITMFHDNDLTENDKIFVRSVIENRPQKYDYKLHNKKAIVENLRPGYFSRNAILNYDLLEYLLKADDNQKYLPNIFSQIKANNNIDFAFSFYNLNHLRESFVVFLNKFWPEFFSSIIQGQNNNWMAICRSYSLYTLLFSDQTVLEKVNETGGLSTYISAQNNYLNLDISDEQAETIINALKTINVSFSGIDVKVSNQNLLNKVYNACLYEINATNVKIFFDLKYKDTNIKASPSNCITCIYSKPEEPLYKYLKKKPENALVAVLEMTKADFCDDENIVILLLNDNEISKDVRTNYLLRSVTTINNLKDITEKTFYNTLVNQGTVVCSIDNIFQYYNANGFTNDLAKFINSSTNNLDYKNNNISDNEKKIFFDSSIFSNELNDDRFEEIVSQIGGPVTINVQKKYAENKLLILTKYKKIPSSQNNFNFIHNQYSNVFRSYICSLTDQNRLDLSSIYKKEDMEQLLSWNEIPESNRLNILKRKSEKFSVLGNYPDSILIEILEKHRIDSELPELYLKYDDFSPDVQNEIFKIAKTKINVLIQENRELSFGLLLRFLRDNTVSFSNKINLLNSNIMNLSFEQVENSLSSLGKEEICQAMQPYKSKSVACNSENKSILQLLKKRGMITDFKEDKENIEYKITLPKQKKNK